MTILLAGVPGSRLSGMWLWCVYAVCVLDGLRWACLSCWGVLVVGAQRTGCAQVYIDGRALRQAVPDAECWRVAAGARGLVLLLVVNLSCWCTSHTGV